MWIHYNIWFKSYSRKEPITQKLWKTTMKYLQEIIAAAGPIRYFHLFEPEPHLFLALEIAPRCLKKVKERISRIKRPSVITRTFFFEDTKDDENGSQSVRFFQSSTDYAIWKATSGKYKEGYDNMDEAKLIHCFFNALGLSQRQELRRYFYCALHRGGLFIDFTDTADWQRYHVKRKTVATMEIERIDG